MLFIIHCIESTRTNPSCTQILFCRYISHVFVIFWHDFGQGGRAPWSPCLREEHRRRRRQRLRSQTENGATAKARATAGLWGRRDSKSSRGSRIARAAADGDDLPGASAAVGGGDDDGRWGRTLTGKGRGPARRQRHAIKLIFTKLRNSFVEFNGTGEDDDEIICMSTNRIYMEWWWDTLSYNEYH